MITRNQLFRIIQADMHMSIPFSQIIYLFRSLTDQQIAERTGLKVLRRGYFTT